MKESENVENIGFPGVGIGATHHLLPTEILTVPSQVVVEDMKPGGIEHV